MKICAGCGRPVPVAADAPEAEHGLFLVVGQRCLPCREALDRLEAAVAALLRRRRGRPYRERPHRHLTAV